MSTTTGSRYLAEAVRAYGASHVFMIPTIVVPALAEMDALGIEVVSTHGEKAAAYMADGYARVSGRPGFCMSQTIGSSNLASGLRDAAMGGSPVVALSGGSAPATRYKGLYQEIEDTAAWDAVVKSTLRVDDVARLPDLLRQAVREATSGCPGPVHLQLQGTMGSVVEAELELGASEGAALADPWFSRVPALRPAPDPALVEAAVDRIVRAERPVIVAGGGVRLSGAAARLAAFAEAAGIPVATSLSAKGVVDETGPFAVGVVGASSRPSANRTVERADLVVFIGCRAGSQVTDGWRLPGPDTDVVHVDIDPRELGRNHPRTLPLQADADRALAALLERWTAVVTPPGVTRRAEWLAEVRGHVARWRADAEALLGSDVRPVRPERLCREIDRFLPDDGVLVCDTGHAGIWTAGMIDLGPTRTFIRAAGSLGWATPASMGAAAAAGDRTVVALTGDGGFYYHLPEIETAVRHGLAPVIVVNNNQALGQDMRIFHRSWGGAERISEAGERMWRYSPVELARVAAELGAWSVRIDDPADLGAALHDARGSGRVAVVEVRTAAEVLPDVPYGGRDFYAAAR
ncbi:thiamine pyrophosphate-binding protein [Pseudonocardia alni]|uniref:thiamine pyrophosphate-binding protein n=1 Tax=Pseudonocardia alni TaxID=33907 RepID=UPI0033D46219